MVKKITQRASKLYVLFSNRYWGDKHEDDEIGRKCSTHGVEYVHKFLVSHDADASRSARGVIAMCVSYTYSLVQHIICIFTKLV
jgi:hypothetical protein